jgi:hypothetical protein
MAWTNIDNALVSVGALPFATTIQALRDNPIAIANADAGAPLIKTIALQGSTAGTANLIMRLQEVTTAASSSGYIDPGYHNRNDDRAHLGVTCLVAGTITAYLEHAQVAVGLTSFVRVLKNGVVVQEWSTTSATYQVRQVNISVDVGDAIIFQMRGDGFSQWRHLRIYSGTPGFSVA